MLPNSLRINMLRSKLNGIFCHIYEMITAINSAMQCKYIRENRCVLLFIPSMNFKKYTEASLTSKDVLRSKMLYHSFTPTYLPKVSKINSKISSEIKLYSENTLAPDREQI